MTKHIASKPATPANITSRQLASISNLTERRLRQLAQEGKLPQPTGGNWPMIETLKRLFGYYQESGPELAKEKLLKCSAERKLRENELAQVEAKYLLKSDVARDAVGAGKVLNAGLDNWLELRLRVKTLERFNQKPATPSLTPEQLTFVVETFCELGQEMNTALKAALSAALDKLE